MTLSEGVEAGFNLGDVQTNAEIFRRPNSTDGVGWDVGSSLVVSDDGTVSIENKTSISPLLSNAGSKITGGYYYNFHTNSVLGVDAIYYIPNDATVSAKWDYSNDPDFGEYVVAVSKIQLVTGYPKIEAGTYVDYANSPDINAFTDGNGYTYTYLGQLGNKVQIATGSYTGTGSFNTSYPNSLTFDFVPKFLAVASIDVAYLGFCAPLATGQTIGVQVDGKNLFIATDATTVTWYSVYDASHQANTHSAQYYYLAIG